MLQELKSNCKNCTSCSLGKSQKILPKTPFDPHVFSNMVESKYIVIGQNPGLNECLSGEPFIGQSGANFNREIEKYGLSRDDFYITNVVHCYTDKNRAPSASEIAACSSLVKMELTYLEPKLVITLGRFAFKVMCPGKNYKNSLGKLTNSDFIKNLSVFPIYHPSGMNLAIKERREKFEEQIKIACGLINEYI